ncbi:ribonuclease p protein subunit p20 [Plakobranchus ocellatus]|uniref:Ribonuclease P protein subunit p20 n=1 Tax=Plakobranchus ocellatus TaxID=259542 RepID=A0AAV3YE69_9GAST|nr:ribonuclease p protein subunit p20 [Plakobranchus ocellatus]
MQAAGGSFDEEEYSLRKRLPPRLPLRANDVYVSERTHFKAQESKCQRLLDSGNEVIIHGLGKAVNRAINLALQLQAKGTGTVQLAVQTSSVELTDDLIPETDDGEARTSSRNNSAVHIRVFRSSDKNKGDEKQQKVEPMDQVNPPTSLKS